MNSLRFTVSSKSDPGKSEPFVLCGPSNLGVASSSPIHFAVLIMRMTLAFLVLSCLGCDPSASQGIRTDVVPSPTTQLEPSGGPDTAAQVGAQPERSTAQPRNIKALVPSNDAVESIVVESNGHPVPFVEDISPFEVPRKYFDSVLSPFRDVDSEIDKFANIEQQELGSARVKFFGGRSVRISWFWSGHKDRMSFSYSGIRYRTTGKRFASDETLAFDATVRRIHDEISSRVE